MVVTAINSASGSVLNVTVQSVPPLVSTSGTGNVGGQLAISRPTTNDGCSVPSDLNEPLK
jgi:hypothetical protein